MNDPMKAVLIFLGVAGAAAGGFAAGYVAGRDPTALKRWARTFAGGVERAKYAFAEGTESVSDLWNEAREGVRQEMEAAAFTAAAGAAPAAAPRAAAPSSGRGRRRTTARKRPAHARAATKTRETAARRRGE
jgi:hypothetical protein